MGSQCLVQAVDLHLVDTGGGVGALGGLLNDQLDIAGVDGCEGVGGGTGEVLLHLDDLGEVLAVLGDEDGISLGVHVGALTAGLGVEDPDLADGLDLAQVDGDGVGRIAGGAPLLGVVAVHGEGRSLVVVDIGAGFGAAVPGQQQQTAVDLGGDGGPILCDLLIAADDLSGAVGQGDDQIQSDGSWTWPWR